MTDNIARLREALGLDVTDAILDKSVEITGKGIGLNYQTNHTYIKIGDCWYNLYTSEWGAFEKAMPADFELARAESKKEIQK